MPKELPYKKQFPGKKIWSAHLQACRRSGLIAPMMVYGITQALTGTESGVSQ